MTRIETFDNEAAPCHNCTEIRNQTERIAFMDERRYLEFELLLEAWEGHYRARVINAPIRSAPHAFTLPDAAGIAAHFWQGMDELQLPVGARRTATPDLKGVGQRLFDTLFQGEIRTALRRSLDEARRQNRGLRLRLHLSDVPVFLDLPWEYLYDGESGRFLALSHETPLVRSLDVAEPLQPLRVTPPLHVVAMIASPQDLTPLDTEGEWQRLQSALAAPIAGRADPLDATASGIHQCVAKSAARGGRSRSALCGPRFL